MAPDFVPRQFLVATGDPKCLPDSNCTSFKELRSTPGSLVIDKTIAIAQLCCGLSLIRRPGGFGKTTLLDMAARYHDIHGTTEHSQLFEKTLIESEPWEFKIPRLIRPNERLVLTFDFAKVDRSQERLRESFTEHVEEQLHVFLNKYKHELGVDEKGISTAFGNQNPIDHVMGIVRQTGLKVFIGVDNYTAPLKGGSVRSKMQEIQEYIESQFFRYVGTSASDANGVVDCGIIAGEDVRFPPSFDPLYQHWDFEAWRPFKVYDLSVGLGLEFAIGLSWADIEWLAVAYLGSVPDDLYEEVSQHCKPRRFAPLDDNRITYSFERVFTVLRRRRTGATELEPDPHITPDFYGMRGQEQLLYSTRVDEDLGLDINKDAFAVEEDYPPEYIIDSSEEPGVFKVITLPELLEGLPPRLLVIDQ